MHDNTLSFSHTISQLLMQQWTSDRFLWGIPFLEMNRTRRCVVTCVTAKDCQQAVDYKRLNCGHSFHTECLRDTCSDLGQSASNADRARLCPICHPLLEDRIRELSTTMNRLVKRKILKDIKAKHKLSEGSVFTIRSLKFIFRPLFIGIWRAMSSTVTTIATRKVTMKMMTMTPITSKTRVKAINKTTKSIP